MFFICLHLCIIRSWEGNCVKIIQFALIIKTGGGDVGDNVIPILPPTASYDFSLMRGNTL